MIDHTHRMVRATDPHTSFLAAQKLIPKLSKMRRNVYMEILASDVNGLNDWELIDRCNKKYGERPESTYRKRRSELLALGLVEDSGRTRIAGRSHRIVWIASSVDNWLRA